MLNKLKDSCYNLISHAVKKWGDIISKAKRKHREWQIHKNEKIMRKRMAKNRRRKYATGGAAFAESKSSYEYAKVNKSDNSYLAQAPSHLSIIDNCEETITFFNSVFNDMFNRHQGRTYTFDIKNVEIITSDAIMYILAIVYNIKNNYAYQFCFEGNVPANEKARQAFEESGFLNYVSSPRGKIAAVSTKLQIIAGRGPDSTQAGRIVDFATEALGVDGCDIKMKKLFRLLIEVMGNTGSHAYKENSGIMTKNWYAFAEKVEQGVNFIFLDTGVGIPATIRKKFYEHVGLVSDEFLLLSAFKEANRSQTKDPYRGLGLPSTYETCKAGIVKNFMVISGRGKCTIGDKEDRAESICRKMYGTLYSWEIRA